MFLGDELKTFIRNTLAASRIRGAGKIVLIAALGLTFSSHAAIAQDWLHTGTGLGVQKQRVAVSPFGPAGSISPAMAQEFGDVVSSDLEYSGIIDPVSASLFPQNAPHQPSELNYQAWSAAPASASYLAFGNLSGSGSDLAAQAWLLRCAESRRRRP